MTVSSTADDADNDIVAETTDVNTATPSSADANEGVGSFKDAVEAALKAPEAAPASEPGPTDPASTDPAMAAPVDPLVLTDEEKRQLTERAQRRFHELATLAKTAKGETEGLQTKLAEIEPKAQRMDELSSFMQKHEIAPEHLNNALGLTAMINRGDYASAIPALENLLSQVKNAAGEVLPPDLQREVDLGYITEARAKELRKAKLASERATQTAQKTEQRTTDERQQRETAAILDTVTKAADAWSAEQATSDPDWNQKSDLVTDAMETALRRAGPEKYPRTEKDVRALLAEVKQDVEAKIRRFRPTPKPIDNVTGRSPSPRSAAAPKSMLEAIDVGLESARSG